MTLKAEHQLSAENFMMYFVIQSSFSVSTKTAIKCCIIERKNFNSYKLHLYTIKCAAME